MQQFIIIFSLTDPADGAMKDDDIETLCKLGLLDVAHPRGIQVHFFTLYIQFFICRPRRRLSPIQTMAGGHLHGMKDGMQVILIIQV